MKRLLTCLLLLGMSVMAQAETEAPKESEKPFVPWKPDQAHAYRDKSSFAWKKGAGYVLNDFVAVEGNILNFDYYERYRYSPTERAGFLKTEDYTLNVVGVGKLPLNERVALFGKAGPAYIENPFKTNAQDIIVDPEAENTPLGVTYSTGASVNLSSSLVLSLEYMNSKNEETSIEGTIAQMVWNF